MKEFSAVITVFSFPQSLTNGGNADNAATQIFVVFHSLLCDVPFINSVSSFQVSAGMWGMSHLTLRLMFTGNYGKN